MSNIVIDPINFPLSHDTTTNTQSLHFDGTGDYAEIADHNDFSHGSDPWSVACWVKRDGSNPDGLFCKGQYGTNTSNLEYRVFWVGANLYVDKTDGSGAASANYKRLQYNATAGTSWTHLVFTYDGAVTGTWNKVYANGSQVTASTGGGSDSDGMSNLAGTFNIGRTNESSFQLGGEVCQFIMWKNYQLSDDEVTYLYASGAAHRDPTLPSPTYSGHNKVVLWLPYHADLNDDSGNGHNTTAGGNAALASTVPF